MAFLTGIKRNFFRRKLAEELASLPAPPKPKGPHNLLTAKRITLLFPADNADERKVINKWRDANKRAGRKIRVLGFFAEDIGSTTFNFRTLSVKDLNWFGLPGGGLVDEFRKESCDILLRIGPVEHPVLDYLSTISQASLKVGPFVAETETPYHLQFDAIASGTFSEQLRTIEKIFSYTNAKATP